MTRWVAVPQRMNSPPQVSFTVPMTPEAAKAQLMHMENINRPNILNTVPNFFDTMDRLEKAKSGYLMSQAMTYIVIAVVIMMMLLIIRY